jgi:U4/U6.U5 tri-snRNP-associated protein 3
MPKPFPHQPVEHRWLTTDRDPIGKQRDDPRRRSASPRGQSPPPPSRQQDASLPTRSRPDKKQPAHMSFNVRNRSPSPPRRGREAEVDDGDGDRRRDRRDDSRDHGTPMDEDEGEVVEVDDEMAAMQAMMGFGGFDSTKGKKVIGNKAGGAHKDKKLEYRQYMNRQGGFNRPLSPTR